MATKIFFLLLILLAVGKINARYAWNLGQLYQGIQTKDDCNKCYDQCKYDLHSKQYYRTNIICTN